MKGHTTEIVIFTILFLTVSAMGFLAARWRKPDTLANLDEWGLGGRKFGTWITWFLLGGDIYTAYTFVAVPALMFGAGALGFFAIADTSFTYALAFIVLVRLWSVSHRHGFVTVADFVRARFGSPTLALVVAITGIIATMPYIALQLVGIEAVLKTMGVTGDNALARHLPIIIAFAILAAYTYHSGLRAPALIALVKVSLIYLVIIVAVLYIPYKLGGWENVFEAADAKFAKTPSPADGTLLNAVNPWQYVTLWLGSALALFLYPHCVTGVLASRSRDVIRRNMSALPVYAVLLGLIALLGYMAIAAGIEPLPGATAGTVDSNTVVPLLFDRMFPDWFAGVAYAAVVIAALVPAAIMSISAANLFARNIYKEYLRPGATPAQEAQVSKVTSLAVKVGALAFIIFLDPQFSIDLQLIGGVFILQTLPAAAIGLYTRWLHPYALITGWAVGMLAGTWMLYLTPNAATNRGHFGGSTYALVDLGFDTTVTMYTGFIAVALNLLVTVLVALVLRVLRVPGGPDATVEDDYHVDKGDPRARTGTEQVPEPRTA